MLVSNIKTLWYFLICFHHVLRTQVSHTYSKEIAGNPIIAPHLHKFHGIINGIDPDIWDPYNDKFIPVRIFIFWFYYFSIAVWRLKINCWDQLNVLSCLVILTFPFELWSLIYCVWYAIHAIPGLVRIWKCRWRKKSCQASPPRKAWS